MAEPPRSRRSFLGTLTFVAAGAAGLWRFLTPRTTRARATSERAAIDAASIPANGALVLPEHGIAVVRDGSALLAVDLACTHLGCTVTATESGFACPCHGSRFDCAGERLAGPAPRALARLAVNEERGIVHVVESTPDDDNGSAIV